MPRDFNMYSARLCSPATSKSRTSIQVSINDDADVGLLAGQRCRQAGHEAGDLFGLQPIEQPYEHGLDLVRQSLPT